MFNRTEGPIDEQICALFQYTPLAPEGLFVSTDLCIYKRTENKVEFCTENHIILDRPNLFLKNYSSSLNKENTYNCSHQIDDQVFISKIDLPKSQVHNPSLIHSVFNFTFFKLLNSLKQGIH